MLRKAYLVLGSALLVLYGAASAFGWEIGSDPPEKVPPDVRSSPGGYRSFHFWHSGFRGGK